MIAPAATLATYLVLARELKQAYPVLYKCVMHTSSLECVKHFSCKRACMYVRVCVRLRKNMRGAGKGEGKTVKAALKNRKQAVSSILSIPFLRLSCSSSLSISLTVSHSFCTPTPVYSPQTLYSSVHRDFTRSLIPRVSLEFVFPSVLNDCNGFPAGY